jgi:hypothetical protein
MFGPAGPCRLPFGMSECGCLASMRSWLPGYVGQLDTQKKGARGPGPTGASFETKSYASPSYPGLMVEQFTDSHQIAPKTTVCFHLFSDLFASV